MCSKLTIKTPERRHSHHSGVFMVNLGHITHLFSSVSVVDFEQINVRWDRKNQRHKMGYLLT